MIGRVLSFARVTLNGAACSDVKNDPGGGAARTARHFAAPGDDSAPLPDDYVFTVPGPNTGSQIAVGYLDPKNDQKAQAGERRFYARDSNGTVVGELWLKNTGEVLADNGTASISLAADGTITIGNGAASLTMSPSGAVELSGSGFDWSST